MFNFGDPTLVKPEATSSAVLEQFAAKCPALKLLVLPCINVGHSSMDGEHEPHVGPQRRLKTLLIGHAEVECTRKCFPNYLVKLFPRHPKDGVRPSLHQLFDEKICNI